MRTVYLKTWKTTKWKTGLAIKNLQTRNWTSTTSNRSLRLIFAEKLSADMANTHNRASNSLLRNYFSSDLLLVQDLPKNQENAYTHN